MWREAHSFLSIILTSYVSRQRANQKAIERLKNMLVMVRTFNQTMCLKVSIFLQKYEPKYHQMYTDNMNSPKIKTRLLFINDKNDLILHIREW